MAVYQCWAIILYYFYVSHGRLCDMAHFFCQILMWNFLIRSSIFKQSYKHVSLVPRECAKSGLSNDIIFFQIRWPLKNWGRVTFWKISQSALELVVPMGKLKSTFFSRLIFTQLELSYRFKIGIGRCGTQFRIEWYNFYWERRCLMWWKVGF